MQTAGLEGLLEILARAVGLRGLLNGAEEHLYAVLRLGDADTGTFELGAYDAGPVHYTPGGDVFCEYLVVADAVLQGDEHGVRPDAVHDVRHDVVRLGGLDHEDDYIHDRQAVGAGGGVETGEAALLALAAEDQPVGGDLVHVGLVAVHEIELRAAAAQISRKDTACGAGTNHCDLHCVTFSLLTSFPRSA